MKIKSSLGLAVAGVLACTCVAGAVNTATYKDPPMTNIIPRSASWTTDTLTVPGGNKSSISDEYSTKATNVYKATFKGTKKTNKRNFDARIVNSNNAARSSWARNLDIDKVYYASEYEWVEKGHYYYCEISSDLFTSGDTDVTIQFSADKIVE